MLVPLTVSIWRFNTRFKKNVYKRQDKNNRKLKILYKCIKAFAAHTGKGHFRPKQSVFLPQVNILLHYLIVPHSTIKDWTCVENEVE